MKTRMVLFFLCSLMYASSIVAADKALSPEVAAIELVARSIAVVEKLVMDHLRSLETGDNSYYDDSPESRVVFVHSDGELAVLRCQYCYTFDADNRYGKMAFLHTSQGLRVIDGNAIRQLTKRESTQVKGYICHPVTMVFKREVLSEKCNQLCLRYSIDTIKYSYNLSTVPAGAPLGIAVSEVVGQLIQALNDSVDTERKPIALLASFDTGTAASSTSSASTEVF